MLEHVVEIIALHDHVVELQEAQTLLHTLLVALGTEHIVDAEAAAYLAQQLDIVQGLQPLGVIQHQRLAIGKVDKLLHLTLEALRIVLDGLLGEHLTHIGTAGGVADQGRAVADQSDGLVARHLQTLHQTQRHKVTYVQRVCRAVKADVERGLAVVDHLSDLFLVGDLCDQSAGHQFLINTHSFYFLSYILISCICQGKNKRPLSLDRGRYKRSRYHLIFAVSSRIRPHRVQSHPIAVTGEPDTTLLIHSEVREAAPGCIHTVRPLLLTPPGGSLGRRRSVLLLPFIAVAVSS